MRRARGMTLLELLVGLMVLGMTAMLLAGGIDLGQRAWDRAGAESRAAIDRFEAARVLRGLFAQAEPQAPDPQAASDAFVGGPDRVAFMAYQPAWLAAGNGRRIELYHDGDQVRLRILDPSGVAPEEDLVLTQGAAALSIDYFVRPDPSQPWLWSSTWSGNFELPAIVRIQVTFEDGSAPMQITAGLDKRFPLECAVLNISLCRTQAG